MNSLTIVGEVPNEQHHIVSRALLPYTDTKSPIEEAASLDDVRAVKALVHIAQAEDVQRAFGIAIERRHKQISSFLSTTNIVPPLDSVLRVFMNVESSREIVEDLLNSALDLNKPIRLDHPPLLS